MCNFCKSEKKIKMLSDFLIKTGAEKTNECFPMACPVCAESLTDPKMLSSEQIKKLKPKDVIYIEISDEDIYLNKGYKVIGTISLGFLGDSRPFIEFTDGDILHWDEYGDFWIAFYKAPSVRFPV